MASPVLDFPGISSENDNFPRISLEKLAVQVRAIETSGRSLHSGQFISSGCSSMDRVLPGGGYAAGSMVEFLQDGSGSGAMTLALSTARVAMDRGKYLLIVDRHRRFYPAAAVALGVSVERIVVVHPESMSDAVWAMDQGLRSSAVGAVVAELDAIDDREARRLQLAAEQGGGLGIWIRNAKLARGPSWAEVQWHVRPRPWTEEAPNENRRRMMLRLLRCRGGQAGACLSLVFDGKGTGTQWITEPVLAQSGLAQSGITKAPSKHHQEGNRHATQSSLCLAAELAMPASDPKRPGADQAAVRFASA